MVNIVTGHGDLVGRVLTSHPLVARISFTGGPVSAAACIQNSAQNFAEVSLELGGKSPFIVFEDADIESAVNGCIGGIFAASGQSCVAGSRVYLQEAVADEFLQRMTEIVSKIRIGDPLAEATEMGPLCTPAQLATVESEVAHALSEGGRLLCGGNRVPGWTAISSSQPSSNVQARRRYRAVWPGAVGDQVQD